jgi:1,4-alpha-glucan branching enzyme
MATKTKTTKDAKTTKARTQTGKMQAFSLTAPAAASVQLVGDFTGWQQKPVNLQKSADGIWRTTIPLASGMHHYRFLVDGKWSDDPGCPLHVPNPYGGQVGRNQVACLAGGDAGQAIPSGLFGFGWTE